MARYKTMEILQRSEDRGYPEDYLIARIKGRSSGFIRDWDGLISSPDPAEYLGRTHYAKFISGESRDGVWRRFRSETKWVYMQMNNGLREIFDPFFIYNEFRTLMICLRHKLSNITGAGIDRLLDFSLLSGRIKKIMIETGDLTSLLDELENYLLYNPSKPAGLKQVFLEKKLKGMEEKLSVMFLQGIMESGPHPVLKDFFIYIIDIRNILSTHKHIRWNIQTDPCYISGGTLSLSALSRCVRNKDDEGLLKMLCRLTGAVMEEVDATDPEKTLQVWLSRRLNRLRIENTGAGLILSYLWRCYIEARNVSLVLYGRDIDEDLLKTQLIMN